MALRHKSKRKPLFSLDALTGEPDGRLLAEEVIRTEERNRILHFCMDEMNPDYREVLYLTYFEDMSYAQAAEVASAVAACLVLLIGASLAMPGIAASIQTGDYSGFETAASMYGGGAALGYIVIGLLAFLLGVCVTVLCFRLRQMHREDDQNKESEGIHGAD